MSDTVTMTLTEFLLARIAEDEELARAALDRGFGGWEDFADMGANHEERSHITRWHPARVLAECEAKRRIVVLHSVTWESQACQFCGGAESAELGCAPADHGRWACPAGCEADGVDEQMGCPTLRALAAPYDREEWAL